MEKERSSSWSKANTQTDQNKLSSFTESYSFFH